MGNRLIRLTRTITDQGFGWHVCFTHFGNFFLKKESFYTGYEKLLTTKKIKIFSFSSLSFLHFFYTMAPDLKEYDEEQVRLMEEMCIVVNEDDVRVGADSKKTCKSSFSLLFALNQTYLLFVKVIL